LDDRKWAFVRLEGKAFGDVPLNLEYKLEVWDSPNSAGIIIDALRAAKIAKDRGIGGPILSASSYLMKSPPGQYFDDEARDAVEDLLVQDDRDGGQAERQSDRRVRAGVHRLRNPVDGQRQKCRRAGGRPAGVGRAGRLHRIGSDEPAEHVRMRRLGQARYRRV